MRAERSSKLHSDSAGRTGVSGCSSVQGRGVHRVYPDQRHVLGGGANPV